MLFLENAVRYIFNLTIFNLILASPTLWAQDSTSPTPWPYTGLPEKSHFQTYRADPIWNLPRALNSDDFQFWLRLSQEPSRSQMMRLSSERFPRLRWIVVPIKRPHPLVYERAHLPYSISAILERLMVRMDQSPILANNYFRDPLQGLFIPSEFKTQPGPAHPMDWYDQIYVTSHTSKLTILHELMRFLVHHSQPFSRSQRLLNDIYDRLKPKLESLNKEMLETHPSRDWLNTMIELTSNYVRYQFFKTSEAVAVVLLIHKWRTELGLSHSQAQYNLQFGIQQITEFAIFSAQDIERLNSPADHRLGHRFVSSAQFEILTKLHQHYHAYFKNQLDELTTGVCELALTAPTPSVKKK